ncbi:MAG: hypothetical protein ABR502_01725 [Chitinophagaceae bacterium]
MKKFLFLLITATIFLACNNDATNNTESVSGDTANNNQQVNLPYTVEKTPDWERGDANNVAIAMNTLRAFEVNDLNALQQYLADTLEFYYDNMSFKGSRDSLIKFFTGFRNSINSMNVKMHDYESVKSKNRNEEWVGLWYTETVTDKKGKTDSSMVMDDIKIVNGKVAIIDSKMRRLSKKQ